MNENSVHCIPTTDLTSDLFDNKVDVEGVFALAMGDCSLPVTLVTCRPNEDGAHPDADRTPFLLIFRAELDEDHPLQNALEFMGSLRGLERGSIDDLLIHRTLRPVKMAPGAYFQVIFG